MITCLIHKIRKSVALKGSARKPPEGSRIVYAENYESGVEKRYITIHHCLEAANCSAANAGQYGQADIRLSKIP